MSSVRTSLAAFVLCCVVSACGSTSNTAIVPRESISRLAHALSTAVPSSSPSPSASPAPTPTFTIAGYLPRWSRASTAAKWGVGLATVTFFGDSITQGFSVMTSFLTDSYVAQAARVLVAHGDGGSGFQSVANSPAGNFSASVPSYIAQAGPWVRTAEYPGFPNGMIVITAPPVNPGSHAMTWNNVRGRFIDIWYVKGNNLSFDYNIDSAGPHPVLATGSGYARVTIDTKSTPSAQHVVQLKSNASNSGFAPLGVSGRNASGFLVHNMGLWGRSMGSGTLTIADSIMGADLVVLSLSVNDATSGETLAQFQSNALKCAQAVAASGADLLVMIEHAGISASGAAATQRYTDMENILITIARSYNAPIYDLWARGNRDPQFMEANGFSNPGDVHPNGVNAIDSAQPSGHTWIAQPLFTFLQ